MYVPIANLIHGQSQCSCRPVTVTTLVTETAAEHTAYRMGLPTFSHLNDGCPRHLSISFVMTVHGVVLLQPHYLRPSHAAKANAVTATSLSTAKIGQGAELEEEPPSGGGRSYFMIGGVWEGQ